VTPQASSTNEDYPVSSPIPAILPTKQYPHLPRLLREIDYICANCSSAEGQQVYRTLQESAGNLQPISGPMGVTKSGKLRQMYTRFGVLCPKCRTAPEDTDMPFFSKGIVDLLACPPEYRRPPRPKGQTVAALSTEEEDDAQESGPADYTTAREQKAPKAGKRKKGPQKKKSELKAPGEAK
jgi:hypothetical protein